MERKQIERGIVKLYNDFFPTKYNAKKWKKLISNQDYKIFTVNCGGEVIGTLVCILCRNLSGRGRDYMIIDNVIVRKDFHRKGIGKDLIDIAIKYARAKNCFKIIIVSNNRFKSGGFYKKCGFENKTSKVYIKHI